jgi:DNA-binding MarR family transcriptional regulator
LRLPARDGDHGARGGGAGTTVSVLAERAQITKQSMAGLVRHLEQHGYVERRPDPRDRRAKLVTRRIGGGRCSRSCASR